MRLSKDMNKVFKTKTLYSQPLSAGFIVIEIQLFLTLLLLLNSMAKNSVN
ncbi:MAG TPA: hypothetical protein PLU53_15165 [Bacteroidia bacterium]|nr:hypothetical protein [Bacteroidia bacterium]